jgi:hypothetical protein
MTECEIWGNEYGKNGYAGDKVMPIGTTTYSSKALKMTMKTLKLIMWSIMVLITT